MRRIVFALVLLLVITMTPASTVFIGKQVQPGTYGPCVQIVNASQNLGTDPDNATLLAGLDDLDTGVASVLKFESTAVPANICTLGGQCANIGAITCARRGLGMNRSLIRKGICLAECVDLEEGDTQDNPEYWVAFICP